MPLEHLLAALERDATAQAERLVAEARATADRLTTTAAEMIARRRGETLGAHEREQHAVIQAALSAARRTARRDVLEARERLLDRVFATARTALPQALAHQVYRAALPERLAAALACVAESGEATLRVPDVLAADVRTSRRAAVAERARAAPVKMLFPLVFLVLPAFLLLTVVPVLLTTVRSIR